VKVEDWRVVAEAQVEVQVKAAEGGTRRGGRMRRRVEWFWTVWVMLAISVALPSLDSADIQSFFVFLPPAGVRDPSPRRTA